MSTATLTNPLLATNPFDVPIDFLLPDDRAVRSAPVEGFGSFPSRADGLSVAPPDRFQERLLVAGALVDAASSATFGETAKAVLGRGAVLPAFAEDSRLSLGAGLVANNPTRFSGLFGRAAESVESFELIGADGKRRLVRRPDGTTSEVNDALFRAVPGGFGYLGTIGRVRMGTVQLPTHAGWTTPRVETMPMALRGFDAVVDAVVHDYLISLDPTGRRPSVAGMATWARTSQEGLGVVFRSQYVSGDRPLLPLFLHRQGLGRQVGQLASLSPLLGRVGWRLAWARLARDTRAFVDSFEGFTFRAEGSGALLRHLRRAGSPVWSGRQSFVLPLGHPHVPGKRAKQFLEAVRSIFSEAELRATSIELVAVPADQTLLSASRGMDGVQVTVSSQGLSQTSAARYSHAMRRLGRTCADLGGRVHLDRSVSIEAHVLQQMYGEAFSELRKLKAALDPAGLLENPFVERLLKR